MRVGDPARVDWYDEKLWLGREDGFLPHGIAGGPHDALQPILIGTGQGEGGFECLIAVDGAGVAAAEVQSLSRTCILFEASRTLPT